MVLDDVADGARLIVESAPALHSEVLRHGDLHTFDLVAVPERFQERVHEPEEHEVLDRRLPEVVIDAEDRLLVEGLSRARARNWSVVQPDLATPMTGTLKFPRFNMACSAGKIFL
jgi:hypothetical protein